MAYDVGSALKRIEDELIDSMLRNLGRHLKEEAEEGFDWQQWQVLQLQSLEKYKAENQSKFNDEFKQINERIEQAIIEARANGASEEEIKILENLKKSKFGSIRKPKGQSEISASFFKTNTKAMNALIKATNGDLQRAERATLRKANDEYRQIIFDAQVYAQSGAGTPKQCVDMATKDFLASGINSIEYANGARHTISDYADMVLRTATKRAAFTGEGEKRNEWGIHTVIMNKRGNACPKCARFAGHIFIDNVWSGGTAEEAKEMNLPLLSEAMDAGLYHPRCKDGHRTYHDGITRPPEAYTQEQIDALEGREKVEAQKDYARRQMDKWSTLARYAFDADNKARYTAKAQEWKKKYQSYDVPDVPAKPTSQVQPKAVEPPNSKKVSTPDANSGIIPNKVNGLLSRLQAKVDNIANNPVNKLKRKLTDAEIIARVGGGDMTTGSCSSLALTYIGNKLGYSVLDFRGGKSQSVFARLSNIKELTKLDGVKTIKAKHLNSFKSAEAVLAQMEIGKEYYFCTGSHAAIIRRIGEHHFEYLELQSATANGFKKLTTNELKYRFGCKKSRSFMGQKLEQESIAIEVDSLEGNDEFIKILGYINTEATKQRKGVSGTIK